jgi:hypothetical protein
VVKSLYIINNNIQPPHRLRKNCNNNDFMTFYFKFYNFKIFKVYIIMIFIALNCITSSCNLYTYVTWRGNEYELSEDDTIVSKHVRSVIIYKLIVIVFLMAILQNKKMYKLI